MKACIARQPIFSTYGGVAGYELLYRSGDESAFDPSTDGSWATREVLAEAVLNFGINTITGGKLGFVNFTEELLLRQVPMLLDPQQFVIEVLENVHFSKKLLEHLSELRAKGFNLALDDYCGLALPDRAMKCFQIIKLDFMLTSPAERAYIVPRLRRFGKRVLAEKVETKGDYDEAKRLGCELFQGYYFAKPVTLKKDRMEIAGTTSVRLMRALARNDVKLEELASIIYTDAHLTYKLLKRMHTIQYYRGYPIRSIQEAVVRMGLDEIRRWALLVLMRDVAGERADELVRTALVRAAFCENLAERMGEGELCMDAFSVGLFSILDQEDPEFRLLLEDLGMSMEVLMGLSGTDTLLGRLRDLSIRYESGDWEQLGEEIPEGIPYAYLSAVSYADEVLGQKPAGFELGEPPHA